MRLLGDNAVHVRATSVSASAWAFTHESSTAPPKRQYWDAALTRRSTNSGLPRARVRIAVLRCVGWCKCQSALVPRALPWQHQ